ncbi:MAG: isoprenyl transferase [Bacteroidales bacterium]
MNYIDQINPEKVPQHIAIIMDGNGRWAKQKGKPRTYGHQHGVSPVIEITESAANIGVKYLTLYTFSTENWNRPIEEVQALLELLVRAIENQKEDLMAKDVRLNMIGDMSRMNQISQQILKETMAATADNQGIVVTLALSYSSRDEIVKTTQSLCRDVQEGRLKIDEINEQLFSSRMMTKDMPDPELMIRTGGEQRISNYLLWQLSYAELYFTDEFWPDFNTDSLYKAIADYQNRERRFGKTSEQL